MRNTYKYTKLYSGGVPQFIEGDLFRTIIPLKPIATAKVGQGVNSDAGHQENHQVSHQENHQEPISNSIIEFCSTARSNIKPRTDGLKSVRGFVVIIAIL